MLAFVGIFIAVIIATRYSDGVRRQLRNDEQQRLVKEDKNRSDLLEAIRAIGQK